MHALNASNLLALGLLEEAQSTYEETIAANDFAHSAPFDQKVFKSREHFIKCLMKEPVDRFVHLNYFIFSVKADLIHFDNCDISWLDWITGISLSHYNLVGRPKKYYLPSFNTFFSAVERVICQRIIREGQYPGIHKTLWHDGHAVDSALERMDERINHLADEYRLCFFKTEKCTTIDDICAPELFIFKSLRSLSCNKNDHKVVPDSMSVLLINKNESINIPVHRCLTCGRTFIGEQTLKLFISDFGLPFISRKYDSSYKADYPEYEMSELYSFGYNVRQNGMTKEDRRALLTFLLKNKKMSNFQIVRDLENAINRFENQANFILAVQKWKEDLRFVHDISQS